MQRMLRRWQSGEVVGQNRQQRSWYLEMQQEHRFQEDTGAVDVVSSVPRVVDYELTPASGSCQHQRP